MKEKIGVGIVSCSRETMFKKLVESLKPCDGIIDSIVVFEDTIQDKKLSDYFYTSNAFEDWKCEHNELGSFQNVGVGTAKNFCLKDLLREGCDHIFLIEDDMLIKDPKVFEKYIEASKVSGIQHFNYSQHGRMNKEYRWDGWPPKPIPRMVVNYDLSSIAFYPHCVGAFSYYSRKSLEVVGIMDERFHNAYEHVEHTYRIIQAGFHPPFWFFADIENSEDYIGDEEWSIEKSTISSHPDHRMKTVNALEYFKEKHDVSIPEIYLASEDEVFKSLKEIRKNHGPDNSCL